LSTETDEEEGDFSLTEKSTAGLAARWEGCASAKGASNMDTRFMLLVLSDLLLRKQLGVALPRDCPSVRTVAAAVPVPLNIALCGPTMSRVHRRHTLAGEGGRDTDADVSADT